MIQFAAIAVNEELLYQLTGLSVEEFVQLLPAFQAAEAATQQHWLNPSTQRRRRPGGGRKPRLQQPEDRLLFILVYFKLYPIQEVQAYLFGMSQAQAGVWIHRLAPIALKIVPVQPQPFSRKPADLADVLQQVPALQTMLG